MANFLKNAAADQVFGGAGHGLGVRDYFSGFNAPSPSRMDVPTRDEGWSNTPVGAGSSSGLDIYGGGSPQVARDLTTNPLTVNESKYGLPIAQSIIGMMPFGGFANQLIDGNIGKDAASNVNSAQYGTLSRDTFGGRTGWYMGKGNDLGDSMKAAAYDSGGWRAGMERPSMLGGTDIANGNVGYGISPGASLAPTQSGAVGYEIGPGKLGEPALPSSDPYSLNGAYTSSDTPGLGGANYSLGYTGGGNGGNTTGGGYGFGGMSVSTAGGTMGVSSPSSNSYGISGGTASFGGTTYSGGGYSGGGGWADGGEISLADGGEVGLTGPMYSGMNQSPNSLAQMGFADGGGVGLGAPGGSMGPEQMQSQLAQMVRDPRTQQIIQTMVGAAMQSGEMTPEELVTAGRIAEAAMHNPALYPQLRQFAVQNGMSPLPEAFDPRVILTLMAASKIMGRTQPGQVPPTDVAQMQNPNGQANGGFLQGPGTGRSDSIGTVEQTTGKPVKVANGEYVIPKHVVDAKGKDFFDKMLRQYAQLTPQE